jgi:acetyl-CoA carboxylase biotin carboxyl carrier protein
MDIKQIKELMAAMEKSGVKKVRVRDEKGFEVELEYQRTEELSPPPPRHEYPPHFAPPPTATPPKATSEEASAPKPGTFVSSPMVGTYYSSPSPDDPVYVKVGDMVEEGTVVCIIEAMKVMNEVKAGKKGKVAEIMVDNADPVEFGTHLFRIV